MAISNFLIFTVFFVLLAVVFVTQCIKVVPQQNAWVVERLGKFHSVLTPGLNIIIPFIDRVAYKHSLKEVPLDTPSQVCITKDNTQLTVDGVLFFQVTDPQRASYGTSNYIIAITPLAQTTLRSVVGRMELDKTFEERDLINKSVVTAIDRSRSQLGREGSSLRDQGSDSARGHLAGHAAADHRRARKARRGSGFRRSQARTDQSGDRR